MSDRPRVFHLITRLLRGGAEKKTVQTVLGLDGYEFVVGHGAAYEPSQVERLETTGVPTRRFRLLRHYNLVTAPLAVLEVARHLRSGEYDLVHTHATEAGIVGRLAARVAGVPAVHTVHGVPFTADRSRALNRFVLAAERYVAPTTDVIVTNADAIAEDYLSWGIGEPDQYATVYSGIDIDWYAGAAPAEGLPGGRPRVTLVSRLVAGKGLYDLLEAVERLECAEATVCVVGDGPEREPFEAAVAGRGLADRVFALGFRKDVGRILAASDVFVLPSYREGTPRVITEAMACSLPVVATDIAGIPEQVADGETGFLVPPGSPGPLVDRLDRLLADESLRESLGAAGRERVEAFSEAAMLEDLDAVYAEVLGRR